VIVVEGAWWLAGSEVSEKRQQDAGATGRKEYWEHIKTNWRLYRQFLWE
jgi:hypothetical protein